MVIRVGKNKNVVFNFLKDRVSQKLQGWGNKPISKAGKVTLLKTAAQSIPNFWMNLLLIPSEVSTGIQRLMNGYWWGSGGGSKGIRWMAWERMCMCKEGGGLGFRELSQFNLAMLAKQGWRLLNNENPLVSSLMKARYYPNGNFLTAELGNNPSYMWRSILASQDIVKQGSRRKIGNGDSTMVWKVPWLPCLQNGFLTTYMPTELEHITVKGLMVNGENRWDEEVLNDICNERDVNLIKQIPLPVTDKQDSWFWMLDQKGDFTVKSCYRRLQGEIEMPYARFWRKLWSLKLPGKIINFIWRACSSCLPSAVALLTKKVQLDARCAWCRVENEDAVHVLFLCSFAREVWLASGLQNLVQVQPNDGVFEVFQRVFAMGSTEQLVVIAMLCWNIWNRRNKWVWEKINMSVFGVREGVMNLVSDWRKAQQQQSGQKPGVNTSPRHWSKPVQGWVKVNVDAARFEDINCIGLGAVIRDDAGVFLCARSRRVDALLQPREAEALSLKEALSWAKEKGYSRCVFETDAKQLVDACRRVQGRSYFHTIVSDCVDYCKHFDNVLIEFVHRSANVVAHVLARATYSASDVREWASTPPEFVLENLVYDSI